jgi:N-acetylglucosamine-6-sulfatase
MVAPMRHRSLASLLVLVLVLLLAPAASAGSRTADAGTTPARPDIIVIYIDDVPPIDGRFWNVGRTPNIRKYIIDNGLTFRHAVDEAPLCCPARANLLTGLHTRNNHVTINDANLFEPSETIATELHDVGYHTAWIGKYLNLYMSIHGPAHARYEAGWDTFEPMSGSSYGYFYWHKGDPNHVRPAEHSMQLVQDLAVADLRNAPTDQPLFAVLSTFAGHYPNIALPQNIGSPKCSRIRPWLSPRYGAAAAVDKPAWVQALAQRRVRQLHASGYPLRKVCEDMLGVDQLVAKVVKEQKRRGRLDDTLLVLASDNGYLYGDFGIVDKSVPWATPVVLSMAWPSGMGTTKRTTSYPTSNIDFAPTFCEIAGCDMGPYPDGQTHADGHSILAVMQGRHAEPRTSLLTVMLQKYAAIGMPAWTAVTTYTGYPLGRWHYIRYSGGVIELYDLTADPWELDNVADVPANADVIATLDALRKSYLREGRPSS